MRQARNTYEPDPVWAASLAELGGADGITVHLREDRRHIQDRDLEILRKTVHVKLNLELACVDDLLDVACEIRPHQATLVPERRNEITTESGLDVVAGNPSLRDAISRLKSSGIFVSLFLDPIANDIHAAKSLGADAVELHTGQYALHQGHERETQLLRLIHAGEVAVKAGLRLHAGHGLNYQNVLDVARIPKMHELNIGHSIVSRAVMVGMSRAVREMRDILDRAGLSV
jgi:pyridoxine 5-phosphate synthase